MADLTYEVSFKGVASPTLQAAFMDYDLVTGVGLTSVRCDHDALNDVIRRIEEMGLELLDVCLIAEHPSESASQPGGSPRKGEDPTSCR